MIYLRVDFGIQKDELLDFHLFGKTVSEKTHTQKLP